MPDCPPVPEIIAVTRAMCRQHGIPLALEELCVERMRNGLDRYGETMFSNANPRAWLREILEELIDAFNTGGPLRACRCETPIGVPRTAEALLSVWAAYQAAPASEERGHRGKNGDTIPSSPTSRNGDGVPVFPDGMVAPVSPTAPPEVAQP